VRVLTPKRIDTEELLDEENAPRAEMERSLRDLRRINRWLGGIAIYRRLLRQFGITRDARAVILDLGTGTSDLLESLTDHAHVVPVGLDFRIEHLLYLRGSSRVLRVVGDALKLPFRDASVDVVTSAHFFHHFGEEENVAMLTESLRVARGGVVVNDTRRHYAPLLFVRLLGLLRLVGEITRFDAPASVLRAYTLNEVRAIIGRVKARSGRVVRAFPFRFGILLRK
jgi:ubiquinone/menaquinone biosynthesis C-methylase UbiE